MREFAQRILLTVRMTARVQSGLQLIIEKGKGPSEDSTKIQNGLGGDSSSHLALVCDQRAYGDEEDYVG